MAEPRIIKKYENRRLYDTLESRYINLEEVAQLVRSGEDVHVVDAKTEEDLTRHVLTQIIVEHSRSDDGGLPLDFLRDLIKSNDRAQRDFMQWYLGSAAEAYQRTREAWAGAAAGWPTREQQRAAWVKMFDPLGAMRSVMRGTGDRTQEREEAEPPKQEAVGDDDPADSRAGDASQELADLRRRLQDLESKIGDS